MKHHNQYTKAWLRELSELARVKMVRSLTDDETDRYNHLFDKLLEFEPHFELLKVLGAVGKIMRSKNRK
jgi:hypothetical protein